MDEYTSMDAYTYMDESTDRLLAVGFSAWFAPLRCLDGALCGSDRPRDDLICTGFHDSSEDCRVKG